jgi:hypothetical protein
VLIFAFSNRAPARENARRDNPYDRHFLAELAVGIGTPIGFGGLGVEVAPIRWFGIDAGIGGGVFGVEGAFGLRARYVREQMAFGVGVGPSVGGYGASVEPAIDFGPDWEKIYDYIWWSNADVFVERRGDGILGWKVFFGLGHPTWMGPSSCTGATTTDVAQCQDWTPPDFLPYVGFSLELVPAPR